MKKGDVFGMYTLCEVHLQMKTKEWMHSKKKGDSSELEDMLFDWSKAPNDLSPKAIAARQIQRAYLRHYTKRRVAARKITRACHAWIWKPKCKDGTIGIRPRLDMKELGIKPAFNHGM